MTAIDDRPDHATDDPTAWLLDEPSPNGDTSAATFNLADYQAGGPMWWNGRAGLPETDAGNAQRFLMDHRHDARAVVGDRWIFWDGQRWARDDADDGEATRRALDTIESISRETERAPALFPDDKAKLKRYAFHLQCQRPGRVTDLLRFARVNTRLRIDADQLDTDPDLLNVANGTVDLRTGDLLDHDRDQLHTKLAPVTYDPAAKAPTWHNCLARWFDNDTDLIAYVQRAFGYSLTGHTSEQAMFITHGAGANGKSVFDNVRQAVLGDYAVKMSSATLAGTRRAGGEARSDLVRLRGARMVTATEVADGMRFDDKLIKELTGGDRITARGLYQNEIEFTPIFKLWLTANTLPEFDGSDYAMRRRLRVIPFDITIPAAERTRHLDQHLLHELPGILAWGIKGARDWHTHGLGTTTAVEHATDRYGQDMDPVALFLSDECQHRDGAFTPSTTILAAYNGWARRHGEEPLSAKALGVALRRHGLTPTKRHTEGREKRGWDGIFHGTPTHADTFSRNPPRSNHMETPGNTCRDVSGTTPGGAR